MKITKILSIIADYSKNQSGDKLTAAVEIAKLLDAAHVNDELPCTDDLWNALYDHVASTDGLKFYPHDADKLVTEKWQGILDAASGAKDAEMAEYAALSEVKPQDTDEAEYQYAIQH